MLLKKLYPAALILIVILSACSENKIVIKLDGVKETSSVAFAKQELHTLFSKALADSGIQDMRYTFILKKDDLHKNGAFTVDVKQTGRNKISVILEAEDEIGISHAVYTFLEETGYSFEISGITRPEKYSPDKIIGKRFEINPATRWRGIRQHVNFPMDISSYPAEEAKEYIRNLVRLRFNKLAIHSYPNLWHEVRRKDTTDYAGNFFYANRHDIPDLEIFRKNIRFNKDVFCIPEIETYYSDPVKRSEMAVSWMHELISFSKSLGLKVQFSIEPRSGGDMEYILETARAVLNAYPMIDELELISEEMGGWGSSSTAPQTIAVLVEHFGEDVLQDTLVTSAIRSGQSDLKDLFNQMGRNIKAIKLLENDPLVREKGISMKIGIYCSIPDYARAAYRLARTYLPDNQVSVMPGHGSKRVAVNFPEIADKREDLKNTTVYSWIEFDGLMFTQQNCIEGIYELIKYLDQVNGSGQHNELLFNHWRTAENRTTARYASLSTIHGAIDPVNFYDVYAGRLGIADKAGYSNAMQLLDKIDWISTNDLPNVGFCWVGAWQNGAPYLRMNRENLVKVKLMFDEVGDVIARISGETHSNEGRNYLSFLENRLRASYLYLDAFEKGAEIQTINKDISGNISAEEQKRALDICNGALNVYFDYLDLHARMMPDRGCEGTLINMWHGPIMGLKVLRNIYANVPLDVEPEPDIPRDAPPLPIQFKLNVADLSHKTFR
jgi:hypothetical protein